MPRPRPPGSEPRPGPRRPAAAARSALALACLGWCLSRAPARAHGDLHDQIAQLTAEIARQPADAALLLRRARLHRLHGDWDPGLADLDRAVAIDPALPGIGLARAQLLLAASRLDAARAEADRFLARQPDHAEGLLTRARIAVKAGRPGDAVEDYRRAIDRLPQPEPDHYLEHAAALAAVQPPRWADAVAVLDAGLRKLGWVPSLALPAVDYEVRLGRHDDALARLDRLRARAPRQETWLDRRGDILMAAGRTNAAVESYRQALDAIAALPPRLQARLTTTELAAQLRAKLAKSASP